MAPPGGRGHTATTAAQIAECSSASPGRSPDRGLSVSGLVGSSLSSARDAAARDGSDVRRHQINGRREKRSIVRKPNHPQHV